MVTVTRSDGVEARADLNLITEEVWRRHTQFVAETSDRLRPTLRTSLSDELREDVFDELVFGTLNSFKFERLAAWLAADRLRAELALPSATALTGLRNLPSDIPAAAFEAGWRGGEHTSPPKMVVAALSATAGLLIYLLSAPAALWLKARRQLPGGTEVAVVTPSAPTNQARHGLQLAQREAVAGSRSAVVILGHGLFGPGRGRAFRSLCPDAVRVMPWSLSDLLSATPSIFRQAVAAQAAAQSFHDSAGFKLSFRHRIDLCARLTRGELFARWARRQPWPRSVAFSIAGRLDRTIADRALQGLGIRTAHLIHGLHAAGNAWSYRALSTVGVTLLESEAAFREAHGRYARVLPLAAIVRGTGTTEVASRPALVAAAGPLLLCTNMLHLFSPWFDRDAEGRHRDLFEACRAWAAAWACNGVVWRPHPAGRAQAPARLAEIEREARTLGIVIDDQPLSTSVRQARIVVTTPSGVVSDVTNLGKTPLVLRGVLKDETPPWTEVPEPLWLDPDDPEGCLRLAPIQRALEEPSIFRALQQKFSTPGWERLSAAALDDALWAEQASSVDLPSRAICDA